MSKGIVMEIADKSIIVMTPSGQFERVPKRGLSCAIGEEIEYAAKPIWNVGMNRMNRYRYVSAAAVFCLIVFAAFGMYYGGGQSDDVVAYVTLDINPSIEAGLNAKEEIVNVRGINEDGEKLIEGIEFAGLTIDDFSIAVVDRLEQSQYLVSDNVNILITGTVVADHVEVDEKVLAQKVERKVVETIGKKHNSTKQQIVVSALSASKEVREEAVEKGVSTGKMAALLLSQSSDKPIQVEELKTKTVRELLKEHSDVDQMIAEQDEQTSERIKTNLKQLKEKEEQKKEEEEKQRKEVDKQRKEVEKEQSKRDEKKRGSNSQDKDRRDTDENANDDERGRKKEREKDFRNDRENGRENEQSPDKSVVDRLSEKKEPEEKPESNDRKSKRQKEKKNRKD